MYIVEVLFLHASDKYGKFLWFETISPSQQRSKK